MTVQLEANQEVMRLAVMFTQKALHMVVVAVGARCISRSSTDHVITLKQPSVSSGPRVRCLKVNWRLKQTEPRPRYIQTLTIFGIENSVECQYSFIVTTLLQGLRFKSKFWENICTAARINPVQRYKVWFSKRMEWSIHVCTRLIPFMGSRVFFAGANPSRLRARAGCSLDKSPAHQIEW